MNERNRNIQSFKRQYNNFLHVRGQELKCYSAGITESMVANGGAFSTAISVLYVAPDPHGWITSVDCAELGLYFLYQGSNRTFPKGIRS